MKHYTVLLIFMALVITLSSCLVNTGLKYDERSDNPVIEEVSELFADDNNGNIIFSTNDTRYIAPTGHSIWTLSNNPESEFTSRTIEVNKTSGVSILAGFGGVYCQSIDPEYGLTFLLFMIDLDGEYCIGEVTNGKDFNYLVEWTFTESLKRGLNQKNSLALDYQSSEDQFHVYINEVEVITFRDDKAPFHKSGKQGYIVTISPIDDFPDIPVKVQFTEK